MAIEKLKRYAGGMLSRKGDGDLVLAYKARAREDALLEALESGTKSHRLTCAYLRSYGKKCDCGFDKNIDLIREIKESR
jgi:hypothetical protein